MKAKNIEMSNNPKPIYRTVTAAPPNTIRASIWGFAIAFISPTILFMIVGWGLSAFSASASDHFMYPFSTLEYWAFTFEIIMNVSLPLAICGAIAGGISGAFQQRIAPLDRPTTLRNRMIFYSATMVFTWMIAVLIMVLANYIFLLFIDFIETDFGFTIAVSPFTVFFAIIMTYSAHRYLDAHCFPIERKAKNDV